jgi:hypothetical protein
MNRIVDILLTDLRYLIADLGKDGGQIGASVYDTAQVLRMAPPPEGVWPALNWLTQQQQADGGWGDPAVPRTRDVPTLAAVLALHTYGTRAPERTAVHTGLAFLRRQAAQWVGPLPEDIPLAVELLLPSLVDQARDSGLQIDDAPYSALRALGSRRRRLIAQLVQRAGSPLAHSWEAWGDRPDAAILDASGGVGHGAPATAAWLRAAAEREDLADARVAAQRYLEQAAAATGTGVRGVVGAVWPYPRNEQIVGLFTLLLAGLLDYPGLHDVVQPQIADLWRGLRPDGYGISDHFATDGDLTAMGFAVVAAAGYQPDLAILQSFIVGESCLTYPHELQRSFSATAHAAHTLALFGADPTALLDYLCKHRSVDGLWIGDKWHASWLYLTSHMIHGLLAAGRPALALTGLDALLDHQRPDGSWGVTAATMEETAYGTLALLGLARHNLLPERGQGALHRAGRWLIEHYRPLTENTGACWIAKGLYRPRRIARVEEIGATLACVLAGYGE